MQKAVDVQKKRSMDQRREEKRGASGYEVGLIESPRIRRAHEISEILVGHSRLALTTGGKAGELEIGRNDFSPFIPINDEILLIRLGYIESVRGRFSATPLGRERIASAEPGSAGQCNR
jgi:hypothetical protein